MSGADAWAVDGMRESPHGVVYDIKCAVCDPEEFGVGDEQLGERLVCRFRSIAREKPPWAKDRELTHGLNCSTIPPAQNG